MARRAQTETALRVATTVASRPKASCLALLPSATVRPGESRFLRAICGIGAVYQKCRWQRRSTVQPHILNCFALAALTARTFATVRVNPSHRIYVLANTIAVLSRQFYPAIGDFRLCQH